MPVDQEKAQQFGWMDRAVVADLDAYGKRHNHSRREVAEAMIRSIFAQLAKGGRFVAGDLPVPDLPNLVEGQEQRVLAACELCNCSVEVFVARALSSLLERVDNGYRGPIILPRVSKPGFEGSKIPGHADVSELGWFRPSSEEAKEGVEIHPVEIDKLPSGVRRGA